MLELYDSWRDSPNIPLEWKPVRQPGALRNVKIKNARLLETLRELLPGEWVKVYRYGQDGSEVHYFEHKSGKVTHVKHKIRR